MTLPLVSVLLCTHNSRELLPIAIDSYLSQNYPNPFNPSTTIRYALPKRSQLKIRIINLLGQVVAELMNTEQAAGYQSIIWNAKVTSGIYFYRITCGNYSKCMKMISLK